MRNVVVGLWFSNKNSRKPPKKSPVTKESYDVYECSRSTRGPANDQ